MTNQELNQEKNVEMLVSLRSANVRMRLPFQELNEDDMPWVQVLVNPERRQMLIRETPKITIHRGRQKHRDVVQLKRHEDCPDAVFIDNCGHFLAMLYGEMEWEADTNYLTDGELLPPEQLNGGGWLFDFSAPKAIPVAGIPELYKAASIVPSPWPERMGLE